MFLKINKITGFAGGNYSLCITKNIDKIASDWANVAPTDIYWSSTFLGLLEAHGPIGLIPFYAVLFENSEPAAIAYFQLKKIKLYESLKSPEPSKCSASSSLKELVISRLDAYNLVCGNMLLTGEYNVYVAKNHPALEKFAVMQEVLQHLIPAIQSKEKIAVSTVLLKDFYLDHCVENFEKFTKFTVQPNMVLDLDPSWQTFDDYVKGMKAKYRTRVNRAIKKGSGMRCKILSLEDTFALQKEMYQLYLNVVKQAKFNLFYLKEDYFYQLKKALGEHICIKAYYLGEKLVGFYTIISNENHIDAHFLGYDSEVNHEHQLYLNMLYNMIDFGINAKVKTVFLSRTAMEIKSSVGAEGVDMALYVKHVKPLFNQFIPSLLKYLAKPEPWLPRSPFKD